MTHINLRSEEGRPLPKGIPLEESKTKVTLERLPLSHVLIGSPFPDPPLGDVGK